MKHSQFLSLITIASERMRQSNDPIHDYSHVSRVVKHTQLLARHHPFTAHEQQALLLAAWWHDAGRTLTKHPSFIWMPLVDDLLSAMLLIKTMIQARLWNKTSWLAVKIILTKTTGTGTFFRTFLLHGQQSILTDILKDADALDLLHTERAKQIQVLVDTSLLYTYGYRLQAWWFFSRKKIKFNTEAAKQQFIKLLKEFLAWISEETTITWHKQTFGEGWVKNMMYDIRQLIAQFEPQLV